MINAELAVAFIVSLMVVIDTMVAWLFIRRSVINHLRYNISRPILIAFGLVFTAEAIGEIAQVAHQYIHLNTGQPTHTWLIWPYLFELAIKLNLLLVFKKLDSRFEDSDFNIFIKRNLHR